MRTALSILILGLCTAGIKAEVLETIAEWSNLDFNFPYGSAFPDIYRPDWTAPSGISVGWNQIFLNIPRLRDGVPATLVTLPRKSKLGTNPKLDAYPSWEWHTAGIGDLNCTKLISTYRSRIDKCDRLWVLDAGVQTSIDDFTPVCPPKILVFDLATDRVVRQYLFPKRSLRPNSLLTNMVIDDTTATGCDDVFVYITDTAGPGIIVYDAARDTSWTFVDSSMYPHPDFSSYKIDTDMFTLMDGVIGLGFSARQNILYYHPFASNRLHSVPTSVLRNGPPGFNEPFPTTLVGRKSSQSIALAVDARDDSVLFAPVTETAIASWNPQSNQQRIIAQDPQKLQFVSELRNVPRDGNNLWLMSTRFQKFFLKIVNPREINIRIMRVRPDGPGLLPTPSYTPSTFAYTYAGLNLYNNSVLF